MAAPEITCITGTSDIYGCLINYGIASMGGQAFAGVLIAAVIYAVFWVLGRGYAPLPTVMLILAGSVFIPMLPGQLQTVAQVVMFLGFVSALMVVARRYVLEGVA